MEYEVGKFREAHGLKGPTTAIILSEHKTVEALRRSEKQLKTQVREYKHFKFALRCFCLGETAAAFLLLFLTITDF